MAAVGPRRGWRAGSPAGGTPAADPQPPPRPTRGQRHHLLQPPLHLPRDVVRSFPLGPRLLPLLPRPRGPPGALHAAAPQVRAVHVPEPPPDGHRGTHHRRHPHQCCHRWSLQSCGEKNDSLRGADFRRGSDLLCRGGFLPPHLSHSLAPPPGTEVTDQGGDREAGLLLPPPGWEFSLKSWI